jgi:hypothetical protein
MAPFRTTLAFAIALALPLAAAARVSSDTTPGVNFSTYQTFTVVNSAAPAGMNPVAFERIRQGVEQGLTSKGYAKAPQGDIAVIITVGAQDKTDVHTWGAFGRQVDVHQYTEGQLSIDAFDSKTKQPLWHGQDTESVERGHVDEEKVDKRVGQVMAEFPARAG